RVISIVPTSQPEKAVPMKSRIFVRLTGTPTLRAARGLPPALKIQLPNRVLPSTHAAAAAAPSHHAIEIGKAAPAMSIVLESALHAPAYAGTEWVPPAFSWL